MNQQPMEQALDGSSSRPKSILSPLRLLRATCPGQQSDRRPHCGET
jgi:hypothetical protein